MSHQIPDVEDRLNEIERALALSTLVTRAVSLSDDLCMSVRQEAAAYALLSDILDKAQDSYRALKSALPNHIILEDAPEVQQ
jgi:hypothetical protein